MQPWSLLQLNRSLFLELTNRDQRAAVRSVVASNACKELRPDRESYWSGEYLSIYKIRAESLCMSSIASYEKRSPWLVKEKLETIWSTGWERRVPPVDKKQHGGSYLWRIPKKVFFQNWQTKNLTIGYDYHKSKRWSTKMLWNQIKEDILK